MAKLNYGDEIWLPDNTMQLNGVDNVVPVKFDTIAECWVVCAQDKATHMLIEARMSNDIDNIRIKYILIEIGKCDNLYLLADAIVD